MHRLKKIRNEEAKEVIRGCNQTELLSLHFDFRVGRQLHRDWVSKPKAFKLVDTAKTIVLNQDDAFSIMSLYSTRQDIERIVARGTKIDLIIVKTKICSQRY